MTSKVKMPSASSTQNTTATPYAGQAPYLGDVWSRAQAVSNMGAPDWTDTLGSINGAAEMYRALGTSPEFNQSRSYFTNVARGDYLSPTSNPFFQNMVDQSIMAARPGVDSAFAASGRLGSGSHAAAFADAATRRATELGYQNYATERGFQNQANAMLPQIAAMPADWAQRAGGLFQMGATLPRDYEWQNLARYQGLIGGPIMSNGTVGTVSSQPMQASNPLLQGLGTTIGGISALGSLGQGASGLSNIASGIGGLFGGGAAATGATAAMANAAPLIAAAPAIAGAMQGGVYGLATAAPALFASDARVKEDIKPVGALNNGLTVYSYRYRGQPGTQIGLLAQEVAQSKPQAVGDMGGGLLGVNYADAVT